MSSSALAAASQLAAGSEFVAKLQRLGKAIGKCEKHCVHASKIFPLVESLQRAKSRGSGGARDDAGSSPLEVYQLVL